MNVLHARRQQRALHRHLVKIVRVVASLPRGKDARPGTQDDRRLVLRERLAQLSCRRARLGQMRHDVAVKVLDVGQRVVGTVATD